MYRSKSLNTGSSADDASRSHVASSRSNARPISLAAPAARSTSTQRSFEPRNLSGRSGSSSRWSTSFPSKRMILTGPVRSRAVVRLARDRADASGPRSLVGMRSSSSRTSQRLSPASMSPKPNAPAAIAITPFLVADLFAEEERPPVYVHVIDHPDARLLVDTGMTELHPLVADMDPRLYPLSEQIDLAGIDSVVNTHLHFDHCGGNHLFAGKPIYVQRRELDDAREDGYTIREWVEAPGVEYVS